MSDLNEKLRMQHAISNDVCPGMKQVFLMLE